MKTLGIFAVILMFAGFLVCTSSCAVIVKRDNGVHRGWYKIPDRPHHQNSENPGKHKGNRKNKSVENVSSVYVIEFVNKSS